MQKLIAGFCLGALALGAQPLFAQDRERAGETVEVEYPDPPPAIAERIVDGRFEPGDFSYLKGAFEDASAEEKAQYALIEAWLDRCNEEGKARLEAEMAELGVTLAGEHIGGGASLCDQVTTVKGLRGIETFSDIEEGLPGARLVFNTLVQSIDRAEERTGPFESDDLGGDLHHQTLGEQMLRLAFRWGWAEQTDPRVPSMNSRERAVFLALLNSETIRVDHANTQWLKGIVAKNGWPTISKVGERGANAAWLLTQHADMDPAFQLRALRLMEPLVAEAEVSKSNYAYLYDRIMLKLVGKQRYATQVTCDNGERVARPLEDAENVDELRAEMGLVPFSEYLTWFNSPC